VYIVLECAENGTFIPIFLLKFDTGDLHHFLKQRRDAKKFLTESQIWYIFQELCKGLGYIHSKRALHRDIKPMNCFITADYHFKLGDFGISRQCSEQTLLLQTFACGVRIELYIM
jgi:serine/threonine protein kinase